MLEKKKPLSMFYDEPAEEGQLSLIPEEEFDKFVDNCLFIKGSKIYELAFDPRQGQNLQVKYVLYALRIEEWRIPAMFLTLDIMFSLRKYDEGIDRMIGALLGYTNAELDEFVAKRK